MILVDTSVWVDHLRQGDSELSRLLETSRACIHAFVIGELACGNLRQRHEVLALLNDQPMVVHADDREVLSMIESRRLMGKGIGYIDAHLLAATILDGGTRLWTRDKRLAQIADTMGVLYRPAMGI